MVSSICFNVVPWYGHIDFFWSFEIMFRYQYQPCSCQSQVWLPWHHQGFQVQHLWRPWEMGPGLDFFPDFVTMRGFPKIGVPQNGWFIMENTIKIWMIWRYHYFRKHPWHFKKNNAFFELRVWLNARLEAMSRFLVQTLMSGWILHVNFRKESLEFLNLRLFVFSRNDGWNECLMEPALEEMRTWTERFSLISVPFATIQTRTAERPKAPKKNKNKKLLARVWGLCTYWLLTNQQVFVGWFIFYVQTYQWYLRW